MRKNLLSLRKSRMFLASTIAAGKKIESFSSEIISRMTDDALTNFVKNDKFLMLYGLSLYERFGVTKFYLISNSPRNVAQLTFEFRKTNHKSITTLELIYPSNWHALISAVKILIKHDGGVDSVGIPSLLLRLGRSLEALAIAKRTLRVKVKTPEMVQDARDFLELHAVEWSTYSSHALAAISSKQDKAPELLLLTGDLRKLRLFFLTEINDLCEAIDKREEKSGTGTITPAEFSYLQKLCLVNLITFNA